MVDLFGLLQDLGERIASKGDSSGSTQLDEEDPVEARFRSVLPNLLEGYFVPSKVKEREFTAILKLLCHTVKNYPGVFYHGKASAVLPIVGQVFPFFAESTISGRFGVLFETVSSLLSLLKTGEREAYRSFFVGAMLLIQDLVSVASFFGMPTTFTQCITLSLKCFCGAYSTLGADRSSNEQSFCKLPSCWKPLDGPGLLIDVTGKDRWQPLAEWTLKLLGRFLSESVLHVEGLLTARFICAVGSLLCFGDNSLQKTCFELLRVVIPIVDVESVPSEKIILSITCILSFDDEDSISVRNAAYDSAMASCLSALFIIINKETVESTAQKLLDVLPQTVLNTKSPELKAAMCLGFEQILKHCPPHIWKLESFLQLLFVPDVRSDVCRCLQYTFEVLDLMNVSRESAQSAANGSGGAVSGLKQQQRDFCTCEEVVVLAERTSGKRKNGNSEEAIAKRCKHETDIQCQSRPPESAIHACENPFTEGDCSDNCLIQWEFMRGKLEHTSSFNRGSALVEQKRSCAIYLHKKLLSIISALKPSAIEPGRFNIEGILSALQVLAQLFSNHPDTLCYQVLTRQIELWIPWISCKGQTGSLTLFQLSVFLEGLEKLLFKAGVKLNVQDCELVNGLLAILQLPWSHLVCDKKKIMQNVKYTAVAIAFKLRMKLSEPDLKLVCTLALKDEDASVRSKVALVLPDAAVQSGPEERRELCEMLGVLCTDDSPQVREIVAQTLGHMACALSIQDETWSMGDLVPAAKQLKFPAPATSSCPVCSIICLNEANPDVFATDAASDKHLPVCVWQPLFLQLLFGEASQQVQVAFVMSMSRILLHATQRDLIATKDDWLKCLQILPLHPLRAVRKAFCFQIRCFFHIHVLNGLFDGEDANDTATKELRMLGILKHSLLTTDNPDFLESLLEMIAEIVLAAFNRQQLFFFSFVLLLEQLDSEHATVQVTSVRLLQKCAAVEGKKGESGRAQLMVDIIQDELFEYLSGRLVSRPLIVKNFADAVLGLQIVDLIRQMVPIVLPKLVIQQHHNNDALNILHELAKQLETELPLLLLEWCHRVLSVLLLKADGKELMAALQFYEAQTGSDTREIFSAVLPALLDELVRFLGDTGTEDAMRRSARVAPMIQEVACIVSGSDDVPEFLKTHFVGLLNSIDRKFLKATDIASQKQGLRCIDQLMEMIGSHLSAFVPKIMVLLTRALQEQALQYEGLRVWLSFVKKLAHVSPSNLKGVASQIVVAVMPCLEGQQEEACSILDAVVEVLEELLVANRNILDDQASEIPVLPSLPELGKVNAVLQEARGVTRLCDQLKRAAEGLRHENISICLMAASELKTLMRTQKQDIMAMVLGESSADTTVLSHLIMSLLQGCVEESRTAIRERFKLFCAECLGELGAVDPAKVNLNLRARSKIERTDDDLVFELIHKHLARVLRAASETDVQDAAALAIQELLKLTGCRAARLGVSWASPSSNVADADKRADIGDSLNGAAVTVERGEKLWNRFSDDVKDIITPCLTSKYLLKQTTVPIPSGSIFRSGMSFRRWIYLWVRRLVLLSTGPRSHIFNACRGVLRHDMATALYLLPYLVLNVVCDGTSEARESVTDEILSVLAEAASVGNEAMGAGNGGEVGSGNCIRSWSGPSEVSIQAVFTLLDNLGQWLDENKQEVALSQIARTKKDPRNNLATEDADQLQGFLQYNHVSELLDAIPKTALAGASYRCLAYARALLYFESHVRTKSGALNPAAERSGFFEDDDISFLLGVYSGLDEPDGLSGLSRLHKSLSLQDQVLINEKSGNWAEALTCCEQALQMEPKSVSRHFGVLNCLLNMGHLQAMVTHVDGLLSRLPEFKREWSMWGVQAAWRLGQWGLVEEYLHGATGNECTAVIDSNDAFDISLARVLQALQKRDCDGFCEYTNQARRALLAPLAAASMESYSRAYPLIVKLHMLHELENFQDLDVGYSQLPGGTEAPTHNLDNRTRQMVDCWEDRLRITQPSLWTREPILALRRLIFSSSTMQPELGDCWLHYAKLCRAAGHYETANRAILEAQAAGAPNAHIELAKLLWDTKRSHRAIAELQQALAKVPVQVLGAARGAALGGLLHIPSGCAPYQEATVPTQSRRNENMDAAKALLLLARWVHCTGQKQKEDVLSMYTRVKELQPQWEKGYFFLAKYCDDLLADARRRQEEAQEQARDKSTISGKKHPTTSVDEQPWWNYLPDVILYYAKGLHKGHRHLFQALPRLLTLWFEFGSSYRGEVLSSNAAIKAVHARVMSIMRGCLKELPTYQWLTAFSQLVSRICHQNEEVVRLVKHIITVVLQAYPQQALWIMAAVPKSTVPARRQAAAEILQVARNGLQQESDKVLFTQFVALIEQLIRLCFHGGSSKAQTLSLSTDFGYLKRMMPVGVIMPVQRALTVTLPADGLSNANYNPFSSGYYSTISGIGEQVEILASLQKPKKVFLYGSDGTMHPFLCKPKDDLRKDARMMEFTTMINRLLSKDPRSRRRKLYIRTFAVIPLTEDCGMVEWVLHTRGLRHILQDIYVSIGKFDRKKTNPTIKQIYDQNQGQISEVEVFQKKILPMFPPVFHKWFLNTFSEPANWFQSRVAYARTTAVWSMVGHIVGLGDRHGENILFDSTTGDCVHVDFSCLFDKGLQLEKPELVPFRLTQNMIDGLGITGYEGVFSGVCEITLSVLRANRETLMSVLETFIHDPLVEWTKSHKSSGVEVKNPHAQRAMSNIEARLQGVVVGVGAAPSLPLSVEGQAHRLIAEAVSHENLGRMYIWWMPWF